MLKRVFGFAIFAICLAVLTAGLSTGGEKKKAKEKKDDPKYNNPTFVPTADEVIEKMFEMAKVNKDDYMFDLGCGDNRICFMAAKKFRCRGVGLETNPVRIREAMDQFEKYNKNEAISTGGSISLPLVETRHGDALKVKDIGDATVVVLYMFPEFMELWFPIAQKHLKPGTRIVSHDYKWDYDAHPEMWKETAVANVKSSSRDNHKVYLWIVPEKGKK